MEDNIEEKTEQTEVKAADEQTAAEQTQQPSVSYAELENLINSWFLNVRNLVRVTKEKDANLYKMNSELQAYRNGYSRQLFKSMAQYIINFREDCAKSLRDAETYELKTEDVVKYIGYVSQDYETLLENLGIESDENGITYNGSSIDDKPSEVKVFEACEEVAAQEPPTACEEGTAPLTTIEQITDYLTAKTEEIKVLLKDNTVIDKVVAEYIKQSSLIERNEQQIVLYPVVRKLVECGREIKQIVDEITENTEEVGLSVLLVAYKDILSKVINGMEDILALCGVTVVNALADGDVYDPKKHRIMKFIPVTADEADKNGKIVKVYTDAYIMDEKVFYPAKIDVYKVK